MPAGRANSRKQSQMLMSGFVGGRVTVVSFRNPLYAGQ